MSSERDIKTNNYPIDNDCDYQGDGCHEHHCNAELLDNFTMPVCSSYPQPLKGKKKGLIAKIPVVIAEPKIQINVESVIKLEEPAIEIKRIRKNLYLTQCELIPVDKCKYGKLFMAGYVRKNIEYATAQKVCKGVVSGDIKHTTINIPFTCSAMVHFNEGVEIEYDCPTISMEIYDPCLMGGDPKEQNYIHSENYNEKVFCELVEAKFREKDIRHTAKCICDKYPHEKTFDCFTEKMVIDITLKLLQNQQVEIPKSCFYKPCIEEVKKDDYEAVCKEEKGYEYDDKLEEQCKTEKERYYKKEEDKGLYKKNNICKHSETIKYTP